MGHDHNHHHGDGHHHHHEDEHQHNHDHSDGGAEMSDKQKLKVLVEHWVKHNTDHKASLDEWCEKAAAMGLPEVSDILKKSSALMGDSINVLQTATDLIK